MSNRNSKGRAPRDQERNRPIAGSEGMTRQGSNRKRDTAGGARPAARRLLGVGGLADHRQDEWRSRRPPALVKLLALAQGHRLHREQAMDQLWPTRQQGRPRTTSVTRPRGPQGPRPDRGSLRYLTSRTNTSSCARRAGVGGRGGLRGAATTARSSRDPAAYRAAIELYAADLLPEDRYEAWAEGRRRATPALPRDAR